MRCPDWLYRRFDDRGRIPWWARLVWRRAHFCPEMDDLLVMGDGGGCYCGRCSP